MEIRYLILSLFFAAVSTLAVRNANAQSVASDFDADGRSDFALVEIQSDQTLAWSYVSSVSGAETSLGILGSSGSHLILAPWRGLPVPQIGVVSVSGANVVWRVVDEGGVIRERNLGSKDHVIISGADFNGNGFADAAVVKLENKKARWSFKLDAYADVNVDPVISESTFGGNGDRVFYANIGGGVDWLATVRKAAGGKSLVRYRNLVTGEVRSSKRFPLIFSGSDRPRPFAVGQATGPDIIGVALAGKTSTRVTFHTWNGIRVAEYALTGTGTIIVGDFLSSPGEEIAIKTSTGFSVLNPVTAEQTTVTTTDGIPVDQININTFQSNEGGGGSGGGGGGGSDDGNTDEPPQPGAACQAVKGWPGSHIYKTIGSTHFTDIRRNTIGVVIEPGGSGPFPSCISALDTKGNEVARLGLYERGNGWAARYYAGIGCGSSTAYNGSAVGARARQNTGSTRILMNFGSVCYGPIDATRCIGSSQC